MHDLNVIFKKAKGRKSTLPPVLLIHGAWHGAWCWEGNFLDYFADNGFDTYAVDLRGHGESPAKKGMRWNRIADYVDDVQSVVETFDRPPFVIGHSMGGYVAQHLMRRTSELAGVGLLATVPSYGVIKVTANMAIKRPVDFAKVNLFWSLYPFVADYEHAKHMFLDGDTPTFDAVNFQKKLIDESYLGFVDMLFLNIPTGDPEGIPVLVVGGERDTLFHPPSQHWTAKRYNANCEIVPKAPHNLMISKHWEIAADHFLDWMKSVSHR